MVSALLYFSRSHLAKAQITAPTVAEILVQHLSGPAFHDPLWSQFTDKRRTKTHPQFPAFTLVLAQFGTGGKPRAWRSPAQLSASPGATWARFWGKPRKQAVEVSGPSSYIQSRRMRYRETNDLSDISRDVAVVIDFIGESEYRRALLAVGNSLNAKGLVTPFDDAAFALELDLLNLERLRGHCSGNFTTLPSRCHAGLDFLIGLGQTIPVFSAEGKTRLLGRPRKGLDEGLWSLQLPALPHRYCTVSVKVTLCVSEPLVAVTVTFEVPAGVGVDGGGAVLELLVPPPLLPPPQPIPVTRKALSTRVRTMAVRRRVEQRPTRKIQTRPIPVLASRKLCR